MSAPFWRIGVLIGGTVACASSLAQVSDQLNTFDPGSRSIGMGSSLTATDAEVLSAFNNPAALGYLTHTEFGFAIRNLPYSRSIAADVFGNRRSTSSHSGSFTPALLGVAFPVSRSRSSGTIAFTYNVGGFVDDTGSGSAIPYNVSSNLVASNYADRHSAKADYYTVAYGRTNSSQNTSVGVGVTYVQQTLRYREKFDIFDTSSGSPVLVSSEDTGDLQGASSGIGAIAGLEYIPPRTPTLSLGASVRSPIRLGGGGGVDQFFSVIPGRALVGAGWRTAGRPGRSDDYTVVGAQVEEYYGGAGSGLFDRNAQTVFDMGVEYGYAGDGFRIPFKIGFRSTEAGGTGYADRNEFTLGLGVRDKEDRYGLDLSWSKPNGGASDFAITASYRFTNS